MSRGREIMQCVWLGKDRRTDELCDKLKIKNLNINEDVSDWIKCILPDDSYEDFALTLSDYIFENVIPERIEQYLVFNFKEFDIDDRLIIKERTINTAAKFRLIADVVYNRLYDFLQCSNSLNLKGFINFRLKDYMEEIKELTEIAADEYIAETHYKEFIQLLKHYVEIQEALFEEVHFIPSDNGEHRILDECGLDITLNCMDELEKEGLTENACFDDLIISSLISMAPRKIYMHGQSCIKNPQMLETIKSIFSGRIIMSDKKI